MNTETLWSLRLGFSAKQADTIKKLGIEKFLDTSFKAKSTFGVPSFLKKSPKTINEIKGYRKRIKKPNDRKKITKQFARQVFELKALSIKRMYENEYPFQEKLNLFWSNHFVASFKGVKVPYWLFQHYSIINTYALGNYKTLVKEMLYSNALLAYLSNNQNRKGKINENLGRELLELFTLGEGHYSESDIKNTAIALAGLTVGDTKGQYRAFLKDNSNKTVFGKTGNFIIDDVVDLIFEQPNVSYFITKKLLKWFIYDTPSKELIQFYGNQLKALDFEIEPFLKYLFTQEYYKATAGSQLKNPLVFALQICTTLKIKEPNYLFLAYFLKIQGMDLFEQPNVKGWECGRAWLSSQLYLNRNQFVDFMTSGNVNFIKKISRQFEKNNTGKIEFTPHIDYNISDKAETIISKMSDSLLFTTNEALDEDMNQLFKYDFNANAENAEENIIRLFNYIAKTPEFQII